MPRSTQDYILKSVLLFAYGTFTLCGCASQHIQLNNTFVTFSIFRTTELPRGQSRRIEDKRTYLTTPNIFGKPKSLGLGSSLFARRYWGNNILRKSTKLVRSSFLRLLRCFTSAGSLLDVLRIKTSKVHLERLPHSEIPGS